MAQQPYNTHNLPSAAKQARTRLFAVLRIIDNRLQALAPSDPEDRDSEPEWTDLGAETLLWEDRETAFQTGRSHGGLLVSADGIPGGHRVVAFHTRVRTLRAELSGDAAPVSEEPSNPAPTPPEDSPAMKARRAAQAARAQKPATEPVQDDQNPY